MTLRGRACCTLQTKTCTIATPFKDVARVQCMCGKSAVRFLCGNKRPANNCAHLECGCCDCRAAVQWAHSMGGPEPPMIMDGTYWQVPMLPCRHAAGPGLCEWWWWWWQWRRRRGRR